jgi:hypothetical protein
MKKKASFQELKKGDAGRQDVFSTRKQKLVTYRQYENMRRKGLHPEILAEFQDEKKLMITVMPDPKKYREVRGINSDGTANYYYVLRSKRKMRDVS